MLYYVNSNTNIIMNINPHMNIHTDTNINTGIHLNIILVILLIFTLMLILILILKSILKNNYHINMNTITTIILNNNILYYTILKKNSGCPRGPYASLRDAGLRGRVLLGAAGPSGGLPRDP